MRLLVIVVSALTLMLATVPPVAAQGGAFCPHGESPAFRFGFAALKAQVGDAMGSPTECEHSNPENGDTLQTTTTGLSFYRKNTNTPTFTDGFRHWGLTSDGLVAWTGDSIDPPGTAAAAPTALPATPTSPAPLAQVSIPAPLQPAWETLIGNRIMVPNGTEMVAVGTLMQETAAVTGVKLQVGPLPGGVAGRYRTDNNSVTVNDALMREDRRALASVLAHELTHAGQVYAGYGGRQDCVRMEVEASMSEALIWASFWPEEAPPTRTALERHLTGLLQVAVNEGEPGFYTRVVNTPGYQEQCELWVPVGAAPTRATPRAPDPDLQARCIPLAVELTEELGGGSLPAGSDLGGKAFVALTQLCRNAVEKHGARGFSCFELAWRRAVSRSRSARPGTGSLVVRAAQDDYNICVS